VAPATNKPASLVLRTYTAEWMQSRTDLAERTTELYAWLLDRHIEPTFGGHASRRNSSFGCSIVVCRFSPTSPNDCSEGLSPPLLDHEDGSR
jgi:hypothetical protein